MRLDPLQQYATLRRQLIDEKSRLETRLSQINRVLGTSDTLIQPAPAADQPAAQPTGRRGRRARGRGGMSMREAVIQALAAGPLSRKELVPAVENAGYRFTTKNPLNSVGSILYGKNSPVRNEGGKFALRESAQPRISSAAGSAQPKAKRKRRTMSLEARERIAAAQRARWARQRKGK